ncbi:MAG: PDDEXK nuclease domain-containing protein [Deltaproteobacteria bacterium]|jgi:predicted nuclease of restriction endonuclease-like (RecB) superfamily|nr:PDDEXK nuclease domain-containing protein [Deltaproteobacteria bacterium]
MEKIPEKKDNLFGRVVSILEESRSNVVHSVNSNMVLAYWLIGREIVSEVQSGEKRADYGKQVIKNLSRQLTQKYGKGFSVQTLWSFRQFYQIYDDKIKILCPAGRELDEVGKISPLGRESDNKQISTTDEKIQIADRTQLPEGFSPQLSWSHYRTLMRVKKDKARRFYEQEAIECGWSKRILERHIHSQYYERILKSQHPEAMRKSARQALQKQDTSSADVLKNPYVLEFLGLPDSSTLHETELEAAIITHLQSFLLELGKGFAFVGRQKRLRFDDKELFVDLVFYNCILKFYMLIDLKMGELSFKDVGQMDGYVRMFDDIYTAKDDNPTIGLILCTEKNEAVAKYSVLSERRQIFASKYMLYLPTEEELQIELQRERKLIEEHLNSGGKNDTHLH